MAAFSIEHEDVTAKRQPVSIGSISSPRGIIQMLDLLRPIYEKTAAYGHFGRDEPEFTWEVLDKIHALQADAGVKKTVAACPAAKGALTQRTQRTA